LTAALLVLFCACGGGGDDGGGDDGSQADAAPDGPEPAALCEEFAQMICDKLFECLTEEERAEEDIPATVEECAMLQLEEEMCDTLTPATICEEEGQTYQPDQAAQCVTEFRALSCDSFLSDDQGDSETPACNAVCT
jgi:hypothetical protein